MTWASPQVKRSINIQIITREAAMFPTRVREGKRRSARLKILNLLPGRAGINSTKVKKKRSVRSKNITLPCPIIMVETAIPVAIMV